MMLWLRLFRGLGLVGLVLGGCSFGAAIASVATADYAWAQGAEPIVVQGNRRVEAETIRSYFRPRPERAPGRRQHRRSAQGALRHRPVPGRAHHAVRRPAGRHGGREPGHQPRRLRGQQEAQGRAARARGADPSRAARCRARRCRPTCSASSKSIGATAASTSPSSRRSSSCRTTASISCSRSTKARRPASSKIIFIGNNSYSDTRLKDEIKTSETIPLIGFLQTADIYDPDRIEADRDLLRRFYLKKGYADVRIVSAVAVYDPEQKGFTVTFTIDEGQRYRFGKVEIISNVPAVDANSLYGRLRASAGRRLQRRGDGKIGRESRRSRWRGAAIRSRSCVRAATATWQTRRINVAFVIDEGPRVYIERINIRGNTRTRDYVIRREFDIAEGDAYNRALIDRAERRLKNLNYFKTVKITNEPGSASDRIVINVDVEEQATGEFSITGGYSTADGFLAEVSVAERNLLGHGQYAKASVQYGQRARGFELSFAEPYFLGNRHSGRRRYLRPTDAGIELLFLRQQDDRRRTARRLPADRRSVVPGALQRLPAGDLAAGLSQRLYLFAQRTHQRRTRREPVPKRPGVNPSERRAASAAAMPTANPALPSARNWPPARCWCRWSATPPPTTRSTTTGTRPAASMLEFKQDFAGVGGDVNFIRSTGSMRSYYEVFCRRRRGRCNLQGGHIASWGGKDAAHARSLPDGTEPGARLRAGRHRSARPVVARRRMRWAARCTGAPASRRSRRSRILPRDVGLKVAMFADAGSLWDYKGPTDLGRDRRNGVGLHRLPTCPIDNGMNVRASVGAGLIWNSPFGPLRFDYAVPLMKQSQDSDPAVPVRRRNQVLVASLTRRWWHDRADVLQAQRRADRGRDRRADRRRAARRRAARPPHHRRRAARPRRPGRSDLFRQDEIRRRPGGDAGRRLPDQRAAGRPRAAAHRWRCAAPSPIAPSSPWPARCFRIRCGRPRCSRRPASQPAPMCILPRGWRTA